MGIHETQEEEEEADEGEEKQPNDDANEEVVDQSEMSKPGSESAFDGSKKRKWNDLGRRSEEFELHLDINDAEFVDTVKAEYRSSSPSWADNKKFKYPGGAGEEKAVSVRKRMEDEIKKEDVEVAPKAETVKGRRRSGEEERLEEEQVKIRGGEEET